MATSVSLFRKQRLGISLLLTVSLQQAAAAGGLDGSSPVSGSVTAERVLADTSTGANWLVNGRDFGAAHYSPLRQINDQNVSKLGLAWALDMDSAMGMPTEPIVVDGTIYVPTTLNRVHAIDAATGRELWKFDPHVDLADTVMGSYSARITRGVAVWEGKVFFGTGDCRVFALDAATGRSLWETKVCDSVQTGITGAPRVGGGNVYIGYFGSDTGTRGSLVALNANTGKLAWRFWNVPGDPAKGFENPALAMAAKTWSGDRWWEAGGGAAWDAITYDESTGLVIYGTAGPSNGRDFALHPTGDRLFSNCIIAVKAVTGEYVWHFQTSKLAPNDDSPENFHIIVTDLTIAGVKRHVAMTVPRFGAFILLDATSGKLISWKSMSDRPAAQRSAATPDGRPRSATAKNWWPMSYNPGTGLAYVPLYDHPEGDVHDLLGDAVGRLMAWDPLEQEARWSISQPLAINGGVLSTAGNLVIQGEGTGELSAYAADSGHKLWSTKTGSAIQGVPVTYTLKGQQYVLVPVGLGGGTRLFTRTSAMATPQSKRGPARLLAFALGADTPFPYPHVEIPVVPKPPAQTASATTVKHGREVLAKFGCWGCHGGFALDGAGAWVLDGAVPDLRYMPQEIHDQFPAIVLGGSHRQNGMPGYADGHPNWPHTDTMSLEDSQALHAYIIDVEWQAYNAQQKKDRGTQ